MFIFGYQHFFSQLFNVYVYIFSLLIHSSVLSTSVQFDYISWFTTQEQRKDEPYEGT